MSYAQIYVMNADGSDQTKLLEKSGMSSQPTWSPNSKEIAFALFGTDDGGCSIYSMDADGLGNRSTLAALEECLAIDSLAWSPDGRKIALEVTGDYDTADIWVVNVSGRTGETNQPRQLTHAPHSWRNVNPTWSPDGTKIAFAGDRDIYMIDVNTLKETRLTNSADFEHDPTWSADGEQIAFVRDNSATSSSAIYVMRFDGSDLSLVRNFQLGDGEMEYDGRTIRLDWRSLPQAVDLSGATLGTTPLRCRAAQDGLRVRYELEMGSRKLGWADPALIYDEEKDLFRFRDDSFAFSREHADWALLSKRGG